MTRPSRAARTWNLPGRSARTAVPLLLGALAVALIVGWPTALPAGASAVDLAGPAAFAGPADLTTAGWTTYHGTENRSGYTPTSGPSAGLYLWHRPLSSFSIRVGPVVSGNFGVVADALGNVVAYNRSANGTEIWTAAVGPAPTTPDLAGMNLVIGDARGNLTDLNVENGAPLWSVSIGGQVVEGVAIVNGTVIAGTSTGTIAAVHLSDGSPAWSVKLGGQVAGSVAWEGGFVYALNTTGALVQIRSGSGVSWTTQLPGPFDTGPAVFGGTVVVANQHGTVTALAPSNGSVRWTFRDPTASDSVDTTPAIGPGLVVVASERAVFGLDPASGTRLWNRTFAYLGYSVLAAPAITPAGLYLIPSDQQLYDLVPSTGATVWYTSVGAQASYSSPSVSQSRVEIGNEVGWVLEVGSVNAGKAYPILGVVTNLSGGAIVGARVDAQIASTLTDANGSFSLTLTNGSYVLNVSANGYLPRDVPLVVAGPANATLSIALRFLPLFAIHGLVVDGRSERPLGDVNVSVIAGEFSYFASTRAASDGSFTILAPDGNDYFTVDPPTGYRGVQEHVTVSGGQVVGALVLKLDPTLLDPSNYDPYHLALWLGVGAVGLGAFGAGLGARARWHREERLSVTILTPFERFVAMRALLIPGQIVVVLTILYVFGSYLPIVSLNPSACSLLDGSCLKLFFDNYKLFIWNLFTGNWGVASFGTLRAPATQFLAWFGPDTIELGAVALTLAALIAYPLGLTSGWRVDRPLDIGTRIGSILALLVPSFLVVLLLLGGLYSPFVQAVGDQPYGITPSAGWYFGHGGLPSWITNAGSTTPTGFPLVDGALHGAWEFEGVVLWKTLLQALLIAVVYVAIFLRFARHAVAEAASEPHVYAARARGVPEHRLLWHHTGRRVLPLFVLVFGLTIPIYIGTQALVEVLFNDPGLGTLLLAEMTNVQNTRFGFSGLTHAPVGNIYQVAIFLILIVVLVGSLAADVLARLLDPRLASGETP